MSEGVELPESSNRRLNRIAAATVVALSVAMAVGKIKDDNIVQAMQADQAAKIDLWGEYQSTRIKAHDQQIAGALFDRLTPASGDAARRESVRYQAESVSLKRQALAAQDDYDRQGRRDDQFDLSDGFTAIALAVAAISVLVESLPLLLFAWAIAAVGLLFLVAGFAGLPVHPDTLVAFLS
jgi:hypothetical protein